MGDTDVTGGGSGRWALMGGGRHERRKWVEMEWGFSCLISSNGSLFWLCIGVLVRKKIYIWTRGGSTGS